MSQHESRSQLAVPSTKSRGSLIEFSSEAQEDLNDGIVFGDTPINCMCPHCEHTVITFIDHESSWVTWVLGIAVWFSLGWMAFWVLPLLWPAFKDVVHHCPRCLNVIARKSRISLPTFRTEVMTCKVGGCAVVLARKYVMIAIGLISLVLGAYVLRTYTPLNMPQEMTKGEAALFTWDDFLSDCGPRTTLQHRASTSRQFQEKYHKRTFTWQGEVRRISEGFEVLFLRAKSIVKVQMHPSRYPNRRDLPDLALLFGEERNAEVALLNPGDWIEFEATMVAHGHRGDPEVMMLWSVRPVPKPSPLLSSGSVDRHASERRGEGNSTSPAVLAPDPPDGDQQPSDAGHVAPESPKAESKASMGVSAEQVTA
mmetsp:Transcript_86416/g.241763  ORF Transcript_86416/g.241763 Transcript_86416/m.241763 type:complete len:368 (-) Transcript_86416:36-1139(-)